MTPFLQLALALAIIIAAAKAGGYVSLRLGQPSVLGELLVGVLLGPTVLDMLNVPYFSNEHLLEEIHLLAEVGVLLLMFLAGLELQLSDLARSGKVSLLAGVMGVVFPLVLGTITGYYFFGDFQQALFLGLVLSATSVSISAQTLMEMGKLRTRLGVSLLGAAVFDDILVVLILSVFVALVLSGGGGWLSVGEIGLRMILFLAVGIFFGLRFIPSWSRKVEKIPISQGLIAFTFVILLLYGWAAEQIGRIAAITGAFLAGLLFARSPVKERIEGGVSALAYGLFVPIFFIDIGLKTNARTLSQDSLWLLLVVLIVAIVGKVLGSGLGARLGGLPNREALQLGVGMISRGEVGLIVASAGIAQGLVREDVFSVIVAMVILTTLITPPLLRLSFREKGTRKQSKLDGSRDNLSTRQSEPLSTEGVSEGE